jgi:thiamine-monophosphate kinase
MTVVADLSERELIGRITQQLPPSPSWLLVGIGDDAAVVEPERNRVEVVSVDCVVDGVHFDRAFVPPKAIGHRALAVNLSDLAAMGAAPRFAVVSMALPAALPLEDFDAIADGFTSLATLHRMHIVGGNLTRTPGPLTIDITVVGTVKRRQALTRGGAHVGDELYVTGSVGSAAAGLHQLRAIQRSDQQPATSNPPPLAAIAGELRRDFAAAYLFPSPRVRAGLVLSRNKVASACMDLSDGLADAVQQVADASGVGATIDAAALPIDPDARAWFAACGRDPIDEAMAGGDDYELLIAVRPKLRRRLAAVARHASVPLTRIGACTADRQVVLARTTDGAVATTPLPAGYSHFRPFDTLRVVPSDAEGR